MLIVKMNHYFFMLVLFWVCKIQVSSPLESWTQCSSFACVTTTFCFWHSISAVCNILHISVTRNLTWGLSSSSYGLDIIDCLAFDSPLRQLYQLTLWTEGSSLQHNNKFLPSRQKKIKNGSFKAGFFLNHLLKPAFKMKKNCGTYLP